MMIVPDDELWKLPSRASRQAPGGNYSARYAPSLTVLRQLRKPPVAARCRCSPWTQPCSPPIRREVDGLREVYGPTNVRIYAGAQPGARASRATAEVSHPAPGGARSVRPPASDGLLPGARQEGQGRGRHAAGAETIGINLDSDIVVLSIETTRGPSTPRRV